MEANRENLLKNLRNKLTVPDVAKVTTTREITTESLTGAFPSTESFKEAPSPVLETKPMG